MSEWQPIETAPKDRTPVLLYVIPDPEWEWEGDEPYIIVSESGGGQWEDIADGETATHWMPLPPCPAEK